MSTSVPPIVKQADGIRRFDQPAIQASIDRVLASLPSTSRAAVIDVGADKQGIQAVAAVRLNNDWSLIGVLERRFDGEWSGHAQVRWAG